MKRFVDYSDSEIFLSEETARHIAMFHPEVDIEHIKITLANPDEVRQSSYKASSILYYHLKGTNRFVCVVVKICPDGKFISSAMTTSKPKTGEVIYVRK